ncbi:MAG: hypothetical protein DCC65_05220 [Planctomycetota bacterium]|nr:MAG: hypothetical protein DCC65_05220 [Planctomycetota bacterium]
MSGVPEHLERLIVDRLDGVLPPDQLSELTRALASSEDAAALSRQYEKLARILTGFRALPETVDLNSFRQSVSRRVGDEPAYQASLAADSAIDPAAAGELIMSGPRMEPLRRQFEKVDEWLHDSLRPMPAVNWDAFRSRVSGAVREEARTLRRGRWTRWVVGAGIPLAAAAALFLILRQPGTESMLPVGHPPGSAQSFVRVALDAPQSEGKVSISFDMSSSASVEQIDDGPGLVIASGGQPIPNGDAVDAALLY